MSIINSKCLSEPNKRRRAENWTCEERDIFLELIKGYRDIIDSPHNDTDSLQKKNAVWRELLARFQDLVNTNRDVPQMKSFWKRLKINARKKLRLEHEKISDKERDESIDSIIYSDKKSTTKEVEIEDPTEKTEFVLLLENNDVNNGEHMSDISNISNDETIDRSINMKMENNDDNDSILELSTDTETSTIEQSTFNERCNRMKKLKRTRNNSNNNVNLKRLYLRLEHNAKMKHMKQKHTIEMENLFLERKKLKMDIEKQKIQLKILRKKLL